MQMISILSFGWLCPRIVLQPEPFLDLTPCFFSAKFSTFQNPSTKTKEHVSNKPMTNVFRSALGDFPEPLRFHGSLNVLEYPPEV